jgi:hypothetical protein
MKVYYSYREECIIRFTSFLKSQSAPLIHSVSNHLKKNITFNSLRGYQSKTAMTIILATLVLTSMSARVLADTLVVNNVFDTFDGICSGDYGCSLRDAMAEAYSGDTNAVGAYGDDDKGDESGTVRVFEEYIPIYEQKAMPWLLLVLLENTHPYEIEIIVDFVDGEYWPYTKIYTIWIDNQSSDFIQNLYVCTHANAQDLTGTVLPYWEMNKRPISDGVEVDAVTGATQKRTDFTVNGTLKEAQTEFTIYFEVDHSFDENDWFDDQPAILYSVDVNLDDPQNEYTLEFVGWTPNENTENVIPSTPAGVLQTETRYITHTNDVGEFGVIDDRKATDMVGSITVTIVR